MRSNQRAVFLLLLIGFWLIPSAALSDGNPVLVERPVPVHKFLDGPNVLMHGLSAIMMAADVATTNRALEVPGTRELNPLAQSPAARYSLKCAGFGAGLALSYAMHRSGHHKAERIIPMLFGVPSAVMAVHNAGIHQ
jgi:hypothetical protein